MIIHFLLDQEMVKCIPDDELINSSEYIIEEEEEEVEQDDEEELSSSEEDGYQECWELGVVIKEFLPGGSKERETEM